MRIVRFKKGRLTAYGVVEGDEILEIRGSIYNKFRVTDNRFNLADVKLLSPTNPRQIWCPGPNFAHDNGYDDPQLQPSDCPQPWQKGRNSLIGPDDYIVLPKDSTGEVHAEGEAVAVISKLCRRISKEKALRYVLGFTCGNDVSERQWQWDDRHLWRAKGSDTFAPVGPWIETEASPLDLRVKVKNQRRRRPKLVHMRHGPRLCIHHQLHQPAGDPPTGRPGLLRLPRGECTHQAR